MKEEAKEIFTPKNAKHASFDKLRLIGVCVMLATIFPFALSLSKGSVRNFQKAGNRP
jgi:hypothetical protein